jgi:hypothetical protein
MTPRIISTDAQTQGTLSTTKAPNDSPLANHQSPEESTPDKTARRWNTPDKYAMRRIVPINDKSGTRVAYRPMIQQGRGADRKTHSEVFRITVEVNDSMAMAMAQRWRDQKEAQLGLCSGQISQKSASRFVPGISLVVSSAIPCRACWKWSSPSHKTITIYIGKRLSFSAAYSELVRRVAEVIDCSVPDILEPPIPNHVQYFRLIQAGITDLPDRRTSARCF